MNLDCPGCQSRLKLDPEKLPAGTATAVCPKCRTRILLPGAAAAGGEITIACGSCASRLKVNVARLKPVASQSKCPKCGAAVQLPAAPPAQAAAQAPAGSGEMTPSAQTRRLDPREIGQMLGGAGAGAAAAGSEAPLKLEAHFEHSDVDLGQLIDRKVEGLGQDPTGSQRAVSAPPPSGTLAPEPMATDTLPPAAPPAAASARTTVPPPLPAQGLEMSGAAFTDRPAGPGPHPARSSAPGSSSGAGLKRSSASGSRQAPRIEAVAVDAAGQRGIAPGPAYLAAGLVGGAVVALLAAAAGPFLPATLRAEVPAIITSALGVTLGKVLLTILLAAVGGWVGGAALPPGGGDAATAKPSYFRCATAAGLIGLLAGVAFSLAGGAFDLWSSLAWCRNLIVAGLITAPVAGRLLSRS